MVINRRNIIFILSFVFLLGAIAQAQNKQELPPKFRMTSLSGALSVELEDIDGMTYANIGTGGFTRLYTTESRTVTLEKRESSPNPEIPYMMVPMAKFTLPSGEGPFLVLVKENPNEGGLPYITRVMDASLDKHPSSTYKVFNFSTRTLAVRLADEDILLRPGDSDLVDYPSGNKAWIKVAVDTPENGWILVRSTPLAIGQQTRATILLTDLVTNTSTAESIGVAVNRMQEGIITDEFGEEHVQ